MITQKTLLFLKLSCILKTYNATIDAYKDEVSALSTKLSERDITIDELNSRITESLKILPVTVNDSDSLESFINDKVNEKVAVMAEVNKMGVEVDINDSVLDIKRAVVSARLS